MRDPETLLHANGWHMKVVSEPLAEARARIAAERRRRGDKRAEDLAAALSPVALRATPLPPAGEGGPIYRSD